MEKGNDNSKSFSNLTNNSFNIIITKPTEKKAKCKSSNNIDNLLKSSNSNFLNPNILHLNKPLKSAKNSSRKLINEDCRKNKNISSKFTFGNKFDVLGNVFPFTSIKEEKFIKENLEQENKIKESLHLYAHQVKKSEGASINSLNKVRGVLLTWLKDSEQDNLEYNKFMTEKKIKYIMKNKEKSELKIKNLEVELICLKNRKSELELLLQDGYLNYDLEELSQDIERFANSWEIKNGKSKRMIEKFEEMKLKLPYVQEYNFLKEQEPTKLNEKKELKKIIQASLQTLGFLSNYYNNLKMKINEILEKL